MRYAKPIVGTSVVLGSFILGIVSGAYAASSDPIDALNARRAEIVLELQGLKIRVDALKSEISTIDAKIAELSTPLSFGSELETPLKEASDGS